MTLAAPRSVALRAAFAEAGYDEERIAAALLVDPPPQGEHLIEGLRRIGAAADPLPLLVRVFLGGQEVGAEDLDAVLDVAAAVDAGLLTRRGGNVVAPAAVFEWRGRLLVHDHERELPTEREHVQGVGMATRTLAALTPRRPVRRTLDVATGCGAHALLAARHSDEVVATDVLGRAIDYGRRSAWLNDVTNIDLREGSFFEPVEGERFDLIVANPPYVVSPDIGLVFRDGALGRDGVSEHVLRTLPSHLEPGGIAVTLASWIHGDDWTEPLRAWSAGSGCDAIAIRYSDMDAAAYATAWAYEPGDADRWLAHYREHGIGLLSTGAVALRKRRSGEPSFTSFDSYLAPTGDAGEQLLGVFRAHDFAGDLRDLTLELAPHTLVEELRRVTGGYAHEVLAVRPDESIGVDVPVDAAALPALFALGGGTPVGALPGVEDALPTLRRLFETGVAREVGDPGFEPGTSALSERRSNQLS
jgi:Methyltransferase small domain